MIYPIGIFFCAVYFAVLLYMFTLVQSNKRGKFDIRAAKLDSDCLMWHGASSQEIMSR
jgi:hypothetical protein